MKHCPQCKEDVPLSGFGMDQSRPDGLAYRCLPCNRAHFRAYRASKGLRRQPNIVGRKYCRGCNQVADFGPDCTQPDGLNQRCRTCNARASALSYARTKAGRQAQRKPCVVAHRPTNKELVLTAIRRGANTYRDIQRATRLPEDAIADVIARLWDAEKLDRVAIRQRVYRLAA